jgi:hypothetical protein
VLALRCSKEKVTTTSLFLTSWSEVKSVVNLPAGRRRVLEEDIVNCLASYLVKNFVTEIFTSTR